MRIEDHVCSLESARKLKELGVKQESLFCYKTYKKNNDLYVQTDLMFAYDDIMGYMKFEDSNDGKWDMKSYSAFNSSELCELLPKFLKGNGVSFNLTIHCYEGSYEVDYLWWVNPFKESIYKKGIGFENVTLANACAEMLIYLIENKLIEVPK